MGESTGSKPPPIRPLSISKQRETPAGVLAKAQQLGTDQRAVGRLEVKLGGLTPDDKDSRSASFIGPQAPTENAAAEGETQQPTRSNVIRFNIPKKR